MTTSRVVRLSRRAAREIGRARRWWLANRDKAPNAFDEDLEQLVLRLEADAESVGLPSRQLEGIRRVLLERLRYYVYFRVRNTPDLVEFLALWHASRGRPPRPQR